MKVSHNARRVKLSLARIGLAVGAVVLFFGCCGFPNFPEAFSLAAVFGAVPVLLGTPSTRLFGLLVVIASLLERTYL